MFVRKALAKSLRLAIMLLPCALLAGPSDRAGAQPKPETVMVTFQAKSGAEAALEDCIARHWKAAREAHAVLDAPHLTLRSSEHGKTTFVDIFTWRDDTVPDHAPGAIRKIWDEMNTLVEARDGSPGLAFKTVELLNP